MRKEVIEVDDSRERIKLVCDDRGAAEEVLTGPQSPEQVAAGATACRRSSSARPTTQRRSRTLKPSSHAHCCAIISKHLRPIPRACAGYYWLLLSMTSELTSRWIEMFHSRPVKRTGISSSHPIPGGLYRHYFRYTQHHQYVRI
jgi:hypothetical protein